MLKEQPLPVVDTVLHYEADIPAGGVVEVLPSPSEEALIVDGRCGAKVTRAMKFVIDEPNPFEQVILVRDVLIADKSQYETIPELRRTGLSSFAFARSSQMNGVEWDPVMRGDRLKIIVHNPSERDVYFRAEIEAKIVK